MTVNNSQEPSKGNQGVSKKTSNELPIKDSAKPKETNASRANSNTNDAGKLAEG